MLVGEIHYAKMKWWYHFPGLSFSTFFLAVLLTRAHFMTKKPHG